MVVQVTIQWKMLFRIPELVSDNWKSKNQNKRKQVYLFFQKLTLDEVCQLGIIGILSYLFLQMLHEIISKSSWALKNIQSNQGEFHLQCAAEVISHLSASREPKPIPLLYRYHKK